MLEPIGVSATIVFLIANALVSFFNTRELRQDAALIQQSFEIIRAIDSIDLEVNSAEANQKNYLITGNEAFLRPFNKSRDMVKVRLDKLETFVLDEPDQEVLIEALRRDIEAKLTEMKEEIEVRNNNGIDAVKSEMQLHKSLQITGDIQSKISRLLANEQSRWRSRDLTAGRSFRNAILSGLLSNALALVLVAGVLYLILHNRRRARASARALSLQQERLQVTLATIGDGVLSTNASGRITYINQVTERLTGWTLAEAIGQPLEKVFPLIDEETGDTVESSGSQAIRDGSVVRESGRNVLVAKDGCRIPIDDSAASIRDSSGKIESVVLIFRDTTNRRREELRLSEAAAFTRSVVDALNEMVVVLDKQYRIVAVNQAFVRDTGAKEVDLVGKSIFSVNQEQFNTPEIHTLLEMVSEHGESIHNCETQVGNNDQNGERILRINANSFQVSAERTESILLAVSDVTQQKLLVAETRRMDRLIGLFVEQVHDYAIFTMDTKCRATSWNQGVEHVLGFSEAEFLGQDVRTLIFTPEAIENGIPDLEFQIAAERGSASDDRWMMRKNGTQFWASGITSGMRDEQGRLLGFSKVMRDLTQRKVAEDELSGLAARLSDADRRKNEFLATLAHELRNPLAPIKNAVQLMEMSHLDNDLKQLRETMARQVEQLVRLVDDLLDVSRISRGKITLRKEVVQVKPIIEAAIESANSLIREKSHQLSVRYEAEGKYVDADPARLTQVLSNLLNNAAKYSDNGSMIELNICGIDDNLLQIEVKDNGIGIASEKLHDIFQMFSQVDDTLARGAAGLGIGLTLVRTLVELHGGTVTAASEGIGHGSTFTVQLPMVENQAFGAAEAVSSLSENIQTTTRSFRVLIVEDMQALAMVLSRLLTALGHDVSIADCGQRALDIVADLAPEVILSDISMPGMTGYELARRIRMLPNLDECFLVAMTGYGQATDREKAFEAGFDEHLVKPVDIRDLKKLFASLTVK